MDKREHDSMRDNIDMKDDIEKSENNQTDRITEEDKKAIHGYKRIMIISFIIGMVGGLFSGILRDIVDFAAFEQLSSVMMYILPVLYAIFVAVTSWYCLHQVSRAKKLFATWDGEDEQAAEQMEKLTNRSLFVGNITAIVNLFLLSLAIHMLLGIERNPFLRWILMWTINLVIYIVSLFLSTKAQKVAVNFTKQMNPEKKGSVYDINFIQKWDDSCDERERGIRYQAGYHAWQVTQLTCMILWIVCFFLDLSYQIGFFPIMCISIIWLVLTVSFMVAIIKIEKGQKLPAVPFL